MVRLITLTGMILMWHLTAYSQTDSLKCFTIDEQRVIVKKLLERKECQEVLKLRTQEISVLDSIILFKDGIIKEEREKFDLADYSYKKEKEKVADLEQDLVKEVNKKRFWRFSTMLSIIGAGVIYIFL